MVATDFANIRELPNRLWIQLIILHSAKGARHSSPAWGNAPGFHDCNRSAENATHFNVESRFQRFAMIQFSNPWGAAPGSYEERAVGANK
jgi:hypothetical protein